MSKLTYKEQAKLYKEQAAALMYFMLFIGILILLSNTNFPIQQVKEAFDDLIGWISFLMIIISILLLVGRKLTTI